MNTSNELDMQVTNDRKRVLRGTMTSQPIIVRGALRTNQGTNQSSLRLCVLS